MGPYYQALCSKYGKVDHFEHLKVAEKLSAFGASLTQVCAYVRFIVATDNKGTEDDYLDMDEEECQKYRVDDTPAWAGRIYLLGPYRSPRRVRVGLGLGLGLG